MTNAEVRTKIADVIEILAETGISADGRLSIWWPFTQTPSAYSVATETSNWRNVVSDTRDVPTCAVASLKCLQVEVNGMLSNKGRQKTTHTALSTNLLIENDISEGGRVCVGDIQLTVHLRDFDCIS